jgi:hypothetical protein
MPEITLLSTLGAALFPIFEQQKMMNRSFGAKKEVVNSPQTIHTILLLHKSMRKRSSLTER